MTATLPRALQGWSSLGRTTLSPMLIQMHRLLHLPALVLCGLLAGCLGPGEEGTGAQPVTVNVGVLKGIDGNTVSVNGVGYERSEATVVDGFGGSLASDELRLGMWVEVQGTVEPAGDRGIAQTIRVRPAARGVVSARGEGGLSVTVLDTTALLADSTVIEGAAVAAELADGDVVEVHGPLGGRAGEVSASRVERLTSTPHAPQRPFELRGRVSKLDTVARTLTVGRRAVSYESATLMLRGSLVDGMVVRVSAAAPPVAGQAWVVDRLTADQPLPDKLDFIYVEGFVTELQPGPLFAVEGLAVNAAKANNRAAIKADGQRVAVFGPLVDGVMQAVSVAIIEPGEPVVFTLSGPVTRFVSPADFRLRNVQIDASAAEYVAPATPAGLANTVQVRARGTMLGRKLVASRVEFLP